jgi:hypothetical protein
MNPRWAITESRASFARVEVADDEGNHHVAVFSGPRAEAFAREYAAWKNGEQDRLVALLQMRKGLLEHTLDAFGADLQKRMAEAIVNGMPGIDYPKDLMAFLEAPLTNIGNVPIRVQDGDIDAR